ncbi:MAG: hypothetical protein H8E37_01775 [Planctomycetes bacterium]|nr:hypothetical protein [Planctomycetota bacterium]
MPEITKPVKVPTQTSRQFNLISAGLAFTLWGGWAWYVNARTVAEPGRTSPLISGLTQGVGSFVITLIMVRAVTWLYHRLPAHPSRVVLPAVATVSVTGSCLTTAHALVGTRSIVQTIAPALSVAFAFNIFTAVKLGREEASNESRASEGRSP